MTSILSAGEKLGRYEIRSKLGEGGMAERDLLELMLTSRVNSTQSYLSLLFPNR
jgi:hypothetical protein